MILHILVYCIASVLSLIPVSHSDLQWHAIRTEFHRNLSLILRNTDEWHMRGEWMELVIRVLKKQISRVQIKIMALETSTHTLNKTWSIGFAMSVTVH